MNKILLIFLISCSWQGFNPFDEKGTSSDKVIKNFDLDESIIDKFSTTPQEEKVEEKNNEPVPVKEIVQSKVKKKNSKPDKKNKAKIIVESINDPNNLVYPTDFPEEFKEMDVKAKKLWQKLNVLNPVGEQTTMNINYMGVTVGKIAISTNPILKIGQEEVYHYYAKMQSAPFYKYIYALDDVIESFVRVKDYLPLKYSLVQRESKQSIDDIQLFDREKLMTYFRLKKVKKGDTSFKKTDTYIPFYSQDALSALFMLKYSPLVVGDKFQIPIVTRGKISLMKLEILGVEKIHTAIGEHSAFKISANTQYSGDLVKSGSMLYWISNDDDRKFLKFEAEIKMGRVIGEIESYKKP